MKTLTTTAASFANMFGQGAVIGTGSKYMALTHSQWEQVKAGDFNDYTIAELQQEGYGIWIPGISLNVNSNGGFWVRWYQQAGTGYHTQLSFSSFEEDCMSDCGKFSVSEVFAFIDAMLSEMKAIRAEVVEEQKLFALATISEAKSLGVYTPKTAISILALIVEWKKAGFELSETQKRKAAKHFAWSHLFNVIPALPKSSYNYSLGTTLGAIALY